MQTLKQYRVELGMSINGLAHAAGVLYNTAKRAEQGGAISAPTAKAIADALSRVSGREIKVNDIQGLNIK